MISETLKKVILAELDLDDCELREETVASEVPGWDSLSHIGILCAVEKAFKVRFSTLEALRLKNMGDLQALVTQKLKQLSDLSA